MLPKPPWVLLCRKRFKRFEVTGMLQNAFMPQTF